MKNRTKDILAELENNEAYRKTQEDLLNNIRELLRKADLKRTETKENERAHWNRVLDNLETCLDETKSRLEGCKIYAQQLERELAAHRKHPDTPPSPSIPPDHQAPNSPFSANAPGNIQKTAHDLLKSPIEELGDFVLEELALIENQIAEENLLSAQNDTRQLQARLEYANQQSAALQEDLNTPQRKQDLLRNAIEKIRATKIYELTEDEIRVVRASHALLSRRLTTSARDERLLRILGAAVNILKRKRSIPS